MKTLNALTLVEEVQKKIPSKFHNINKGGCAYFARYFYEEFIKLKLEVEIEIKGLKSWCGGYQHIFLVIHEKPFDAQNWIENELRAFRADAIDSLNYGELKRLTPIEDTINWNSEFGGIEVRRKLKRSLQAYFRSKREALKNR